MRWDEFSDLVAGLNEQTPLVRVAQIRLETDPAAISRMTPDQRAMRAEWQRKRALSKPMDETMAFHEEMQEAMKKLFLED